MSLRRPLAAIVLAVALAPAAARADVSPADREKARNLAEEGQSALDRRDYPLALDRFSRADAIIHAPTLFLGVARAQAGLGKLTTAQESYARIVREGVTPRSPSSWLDALESARREGSALAARVPSITVHVPGVPGAAATLDGAPIALDAKLPVDPGAHLIRAEAPGRAPTQTTVTVAEGANEAASLALEPLAAAPPPHLDVPPPSPARSPLKIVGIAALGAGGVGLVIGAIGGILAVGKHGDLAKQCPAGHCSPALQADIDAYHTFTTLSTVGLAAGGVLAAAGVVFLVAAPKPPSPSQSSTGAWIAPVIGPGFVGAQGRF